MVTCNSQDRLSSTLVNSCIHARFAFKIELQGSENHLLDAGDLKGEIQLFFPFCKGKKKQKTLAGINSLGRGGMLSFQMLLLVLSSVLR
jgi:hypothetical protein